MEPTKLIESHLMRLNLYKTLIKNIKHQLEELKVPSLVDYGYELRSMDFILNDTEHCAIEGIEGKKTKHLKFLMNQYQIVIDSIENVVAVLEPKQQLFFKLRYLEGKTIEECRQALNYAQEKSVYQLKKQMLEAFCIGARNLID